MNDTRTTAEAQLKNWADAVLTSHGQSDERVRVAMYANSVLQTLETLRWVVENGNTER
jgi:hypothetical protein